MWARDFGQPRPAGRQATSRSLRRPSCVNASHETKYTVERSLTSVDRTCAVAFSTLSILSAEILHRARLDLSLHLRSQTCQQDKPPEHYLAVRVMVRSPSTLVSSLGPARPRPQMRWPLPTDPARDHVRSCVRPCLPLPSRLCANHWSLTPCARVVCASLAGFACASV